VVKADLQGDLLLMHRNFLNLQQPADRCLKSQIRWLNNLRPNSPPAIWRIRRFVFGQLCNFRTVVEDISGFEA